MGVISLRLNDRDTALVKDYAAMNNISVSDLIRQAVIERIEDEYDLAAYDKAMAAFRKNPKTYTLDEIEEELGLK